MNRSFYKRWPRSRRQRELKDVPRVKRVVLEIPIIATQDHRRDKRDNAIAVIDAVEAALSGFRKGKVEKEFYVVTDRNVKQITLTQKKQWLTK